MSTDSAVAAGVGLARAPLVDRPAPVALTLCAANLAVLGEIKRLVSDLQHFDEAIKFASATEH